MDLHGANEATLKAEGLKLGGIDQAGDREMILARSAVSGGWVACVVFCSVLTALWRAM